MGSWHFLCLEIGSFGWDYVGDPSCSVHGASCNTNPRVSPTVKSILDTTFTIENRSLSTTIVQMSSEKTSGTTSAATDNDKSSIRDTLEGIWILDKDRGQWSMRGYLETLHVNEMAIQAHEKGEMEYDTIHDISFEDAFNKVRIVKRSRVNNDLVVELTIGEEFVQYLKPDNRPKKSLATTEDPGLHLQIQSSLLTMNGLAHVSDVKRLVQEGDSSVLVQELTIVNDQTGQSNTTTRYFKPFHGTLDMDDAMDES